MLRIAIVEDDQIYRNEYRVYLDHYFKETGEVFSITEFTDGDGILENYKGDYDIILMDVEMAFVDGMTAAQEIRKMDSDVIIIFITNMSQYAIKGYTVDALDYILKPVSYYAFSQTIRRALQRKAERKERFLVVNIKGGIKKIEVNKVKYIEVMDHDLIFHTIDGLVESKGSIKSLEEELSEDGFFQCNKAFLINLAYVDGVQNNDVYLGDDVVSVSRAKKKPMMDALNRYMSYRKG